MIVDENIKRGDHKFFSSRKWIAVNGWISGQLHCCSITLKEWEPHQPFYDAKYYQNVQSRNRWS